MPPATATTLIRWGLWLGCGVPGIVLWLRWQAGHLGVVPSEVLLHQTGRMALLLLMATLALGFVLSLLRWKPLYAARRPLGVWTFLYACAHGGVWFWLDQGAVGEFALMELREMLHLKLGLAALLLMLPLALSSVDAAPRLIGFRHWKRLHLLVWPAAALVLAHAWVVSRFGSPLVLWLTGVMLVLMATRLRAALRHRK